MQDAEFLPVGPLARGGGVAGVQRGGGRPLYLFYNDAYIPGLPYNGGMASINGAGAHTPWGVFNTIPPLP